MTDTTRARRADARNCSVVPWIFSAVPRRPMSPVLRRRIDADGLTFPGANEPNGSPSPPRSYRKCPHGERSGFAPRSPSRPSAGVGGDGAKQVAVPPVAGLRRRLEYPWHIESRSTMARAHPLPRHSLHGADETSPMRAATRKNRGIAPTAIREHGGGARAQRVRMFFFRTSRTMAAVRTPRWRVRRAQIATRAREGSSTTAITRALKIQVG